VNSSNPLKPQIEALKTWVSKFDELNLRERVVVGGGLLAVTWALWFASIDQHFTDEKTLLTRTVQTLESEKRTGEQTRAELQALAQQDPDQPVRQKIGTVSQQLKDITTRLESTLSQFIPPQDMTLVLRDLISDHKNLKLRLLNRLPARELLPPEESTNLYMHPLQLELEGEYLEVLDYVASLETGDWQFNWQSLEYTTKTYPNGVATIEIETLSRDKHWLGL